MNRPLILVFYILLLITTILRATEFAFRIATTDPETTAYYVNLTAFYLNEFGLFFVICVEITLILTMHRLLLSLKLLLGETSVEKMKNQECIGLVLALMYASICFAISLATWIQAYEI